MNKRSILKVLAALLVLSMLLTACGGAASTDKESTPAASTAADTTSDATAPGASDIPKFEDLQFPDQLPVKPPMAEKGWYGYDNMDKKYTVTILTHSYGKPALAADKDPVAMWLQSKFNVELQLEAVLQDDLETTISTRFAAGDEPDLFYSPNNKKEIAYNLSNQGLLIDAKTIYPLMPQTCKFVTNNMIAWSTNPSNKELPFITKYGIQDGVWGFSVRQDWLAKFNMQPPKTHDELMAYAKACVDNDPDGNGKKDTYFMAGAGNGQSFGMLGGFETAYGNPAPIAVDGQLSHPVFNDVRMKYLQLLNEFYNAGVLSPDWYTIEWEKNKAYTMNDKIGMVWYPAGALLAEYTQAKNKAPGSEKIWTYWKEFPIEGGKYNASGNPGYTWAFSKKGFSDEGKLKRVAHMLDTMVIGGDNFFQTIQGSTDEVFAAAGIKVETPRETVYNDDGTFYLYNEDGFPWREKDGFGPIGIWQEFGLSVIWQRNAPKGATEFDKSANETANQLNNAVLSYDRWPNDGLKVNVALNELAPNLPDFEKAQELAFVTGKRPFSDWEKYQKEWLAKGGKKVIESIAQQLNVPVPDYAK